MIKLPTNNQRGHILIALTVTIPALALIVASYLALSLSGLRAAKHDQSQTHAQLSADAGIDYALAQLEVDEDWTGTVNPLELNNDGNSRATYDIDITTPDADNKTITVTAKGYTPISNVNPNSTVKIEVNLRPVRSGTYSVVSGQGGLFMSNSAKITGGDVFINGEVDMKNTAQIGLSTKSVNVYVANQTCPIPATSTYPRLCNAGENDNPITFNNSAHIYGNVQANHQSSGANMSDPGLTASSGVVPEPLPSHDRNAQKAAVATTITGSSASCSGSQTRTWTANTKITGDVTVANSCTVTIEGDVWITGNLEVKNSGRLKIADSVGGTQPDIMVDGSGGAAYKNSAKIVSNASSTGAQTISYWSAASCSPDCADVTGLDLYNSRNTITVSVDNSAEGAQSIFYARWSRVLIKNDGQIGAVVGQTVELKNSAAITFGTSVGGGGTTTWVIDGYRRVFD